MTTNNQPQYKTERHPGTQTEIDKRIQEYVAQFRPKPILTYRDESLNKDVTVYEPRHAIGANINRDVVRL